MTALALHQGGALASHNSGRMAVADIISHVAMVQEVMRAVMRPEVHYGVIPGTGDKPTLYKQGAEVLCMAFRVADSYQVEDLSTADVVRYRVTCTGVHQVNGVVLGTGMGEASSGEEKYKWRKAWDEEFDATPANLRRVKSGKYKTKQVRTEPADLANTILKMANKRAKIAMTINVTACGDMFGQDLEDMEETLREHLTRKPGDEGAHQPSAAPQTAAPTFYDQTDFDANLSVWMKVIKKGQKPDDVIAKVNSANPKTPLSDAQKDRIRALAQTAAASTAGATDAVVKPSHAEVLAKLRAAPDEDALNTVLDLAASLDRTVEERAAEEACYDECLAALRG